MKKITESELKDRVNLLKEYLASLDERVTPDGKGGYTGRLVPQPGDSDYVPPTAAPATAPATAPAAATGKLNPDAKCTMCGHAYKDHFNFEPAGDPTGKVKSTRFRHPASPTDDFFPGLHEAPPTAPATAPAGGPPYPEPKDGIRPRGSKWNPQTGQWDYTPLVPTPAPATTPTAVTSPVAPPTPITGTALPPLAPEVNPTDQRLANNTQTTPAASAPEFSPAASDAAFKQAMANLNSPQSAAKVSAPAAVPVDPRDGPTGQALARMGISKQNRLDQAFVDKMLGAGKYKAGSAESNLALLKTKPATPTPPAATATPTKPSQYQYQTYPPKDVPPEDRARLGLKETVSYEDDQTLARIVSLSRR